jgi:hypothetical protein
MGNITDINQAVTKQALEMLQVDEKLDITTSIPHSEKGHLVVGEKYEMYAPTAKGSADALGITWEDKKNYSFTYAGTINMHGELYICATDTHYGGKMIPEPVQFAFDELRQILGASPLCPTYIALRFIRPVTE